jgi:MFS family permease
MGTIRQRSEQYARWMALAAALLGWMFDGLEQGLFPLVARPALSTLLGPDLSESQVALWLSVATSAFLVGAATGGVLFGWLGDRIGRVRAMTLSVLCYAVFSGLCAFVGQAWQIAVFRFLSALGMGGEWSLGVALVMEIWPESSRSVMAGLIGAAANVGFLVIAFVGIGLSTILVEVRQLLLWVGFSDSSIELVLAGRGWRLLMLFGAAPALLTFFIRIFVPESKRWQKEQERGAVSHWATRDLAGVIVGVAGASLVIFLWTRQLPWVLRLSGTTIGLAVAVAGYIYPVARYLGRAAGPVQTPSLVRRQVVSRMMLGACLAGIPLLCTWGATQWIPTWADQLAGPAVPRANAYAGICSASGAVIGAVLGALAGRWLARKTVYALLCVLSLCAATYLFRYHAAYGPGFLFSVFLMGLTTASFYGWLPLYLPELFPTRIRATGQGFSYNFGRILAAMGVLQVGNMMQSVFKNNYPEALSVVSLVYVIGLILIWFAPETFGKPLPE